MTTASNSYAARAYSEHPLAIWPLDDDVSFLSRISDTNRKFRNLADSANNWTLTGCTATNSPTLPDIDSPFEDEIYSALMVTAAADDTIIEAVSPAIFQFDQLNQTLTSFVINIYVYQSSAEVNWYEFGYRYYDTTAGVNTDVVERVTAPSLRSWINLSATFPVDEFDTDSCYLILRVNVNTGSHTFIMNGLSVGQWSEPTASKSLGSEETIQVPAEQYGILSNNAYYQIEDNRLLAVNEGVPMVFGSDNVTKLYPSTIGAASFVFPGLGMMSEAGRYREYTLEFWLKIKPNTKESRRILGNTDSDFGLYVSEGFITLLAGDNFATHNVGEWYRPMLVHVEIKRDAIALLINGEQVAEVEINRATINYPTNDWWGFYSYDDIEIFQIDCIGIYPYVVPMVVAKKRFVWGQGVGPAEFVDIAFEGTTAAVNFPYAGYDANRIYPDIERWDAGAVDNMAVSRTSLSVPNYQLPTIFLGGRDVQEWYTDNKAFYLDDGDDFRFITFRPNLSGDTNWTENCYLNFPSVNFLQSDLVSVYGVFRADNISEERPLLRFVNSITGKIFEIVMFEDEVRYRFDGDDLITDVIDTDEKFVAGIHIPTFASSYGYDVQTFFSTPALIQLYVGGNGTSTFEGKIYRVGFSDATNYAGVSQYFDADGTADSGDGTIMVGHFASYTLSPLERLNRYFLDISVSGIWEEYLPLSYFGSYVTNRNGKKYYDVDYLQINIGYPSVIDRNEETIVNMGWTYAELFELYNSPEQRTYEILDNELITHYDDYEDLNTDSETIVEIATSRSSMDSYITFQLMVEGADEPLASFPYTKELDTSFVIDAGFENTSGEPYRAYQTKFAFVDNVVVYPPKNIDFEQVAMVIHLVVNQEGILSMPLKVRDLEVASKALSDNVFTEVGTKFGVPLYPYVKSGVYYDKKAKNPITVYKRDTPYLYLTEKSGIKVMTYGSEISEYGMAMSINPSRAEVSQIGALNLWAKYDLVNFPITNAPIFELDHLGGTIEFMIKIDDSGQRGVISARDKATKLTFTGLAFYQNGLLVQNPVIGLNEWNVLGVAFDEPVDFRGYAGSLNLFSGMLFNFISTYKPSGLGEITTNILRPWSLVLNDPDISGSDLTWQYWYDHDGEVHDWKSVYILAEDRNFSITPNDIYSAYAGTNRNIVDDSEGIVVTDTDFAVFADASWLHYSGKPI